LMGGKKKNLGFESLGGLVFSTNPDAIQQNQLSEEEEAIDASSQDLRIWLDRKNRKGKAVTLITGFDCPDSQIKDLAKTLKTKCGVGGGDKDGEIFIQGDHRKKVLELLLSEGYRAKLAGG
jgi:translation initiation factor 1